MEDNQNLVSTIAAQEWKARAGYLEFENEMICNIINDFWYSITSFLHEKGIVQLSLRPSRFYTMLFDWYDKSFYYRGTEQIIHDMEEGAETLPFPKKWDYLRKKFERESHHWNNLEEVKKRFDDLQKYLGLFKGNNIPQTELVQSISNALPYIPQLYNEGLSKLTFGLWKNIGKTRAILCPPNGRRKFQNIEADANKDTLSYFGLMAMMEKYIGVGGHRGTFFCPLIDPVTGLLFGELFFTLKKEEFAILEHFIDLHPKQAVIDELLERMADFAVQVGGRYFQIVLLNKFIANVMMDAPRYWNPNVAIGEYLSSLMPFDKYSLEIEGKNKEVEIVEWNRKQFHDSPYYIMKRELTGKEVNAKEILMNEDGLGGCKLTLRAILSDDVPEIVKARENKLGEIIKIALYQLRMTEMNVDKTFNSRFNLGWNSVLREKVHFNFHDFTLTTESKKKEFPEKYANFQRQILELDNSIKKDWSSTNLKNDWIANASRIGERVGTSAIADFITNPENLKVISHESNEEAKSCPFPAMCSISPSECPLCNGVVPESLLKALGKHEKNEATKVEDCLIRVFKDRMEYEKSGDNSLIHISKKTPIPPIVSCLLLGIWWDYYKSVGDIVLTEKRLTISELNSNLKSIIEAYGKKCDNNNLNKSNIEIFGPVEMLNIILCYSVGDACIHSVKEGIIKIEVEESNSSLMIKVINPTPPKKAIEPRGGGGSWELCNNVTKCIGVGFDKDLKEVDANNFVTTMLSIPKESENWYIRVPKGANND